jgi:Golgi nucleoside diphosphatase
MIEKSKVFSPVRSRTGMNQSSKYLFPLFTGILVFGFVFFYMRYYQTLLSKDRSENYNVKVIPINLDDSNLAELDKQVFSYLAVIDAGSSGCRAHVYRYGKLGSLTGPLYVLPQHQSQKVKPGLSSFANSPMEAGPSLSKLIDFIKTQVPENLWKDTPIWLKATAGLRLLEKSASDAVLLSVRQFLKDPQNSPFIFKSSYASIISGNEEGAFGWIAFNYLKKVIGPRKTGNVLPFAVVEMGGASSQVSEK